MIRRVITVIAFIFIVAMYCRILPFAAKDLQKRDVLYSLPPKVLRIVSLEFKGVISDLYFLNSLTFLGETTQKQNNITGSRDKANEWVYQNLTNSIILDDYFFDSYNLMNTSLIWERYKLKEVNDYITRGVDKRYWDWMIAFYVGFNSYYFMDEYEKSFKFLKIASDRQGGNPFLASLAAKIAQRANKTNLAIAYLESQIQNSRDRKNVSKALSGRLDSLKKIYEIEQAIEKFRKDFKVNPETIDVLMLHGYITRLPVDPYGGKYYLDDEGKVKTTSDRR